MHESRVHDGLQAHGMFMARLAMWLMRHGWVMAGWHEHLRARMQ